MQPDQPTSGITAFLFGVVVLILSAVLLAGLVRKRIGSSAKITETRREFEFDNAELARLEALRDKRLLELAASQSTPLENGDVDDLASLSEGLHDQEVRIRALQRHVSSLLEEIDEQQRRFSAYKISFVSNTRNAAIGKSLGVLRIRNGRTYQNAVIVVVSDIGLEIRHSDGSARIKASDLDDHMQELYQWNTSGSASEVMESASGQSP
jgi:hypothetical protein